MTAEFTF